VRAWDEAGNESAANARFVANLATLALTGPTPGTTLDRFALNLEWEIDTPVRVTRMAYRVNGGRERTMCFRTWYKGVPEVCARAEVGRSARAWVVDSLLQGPARVQVFAYDTLGQQVATAETRLQVQVPARRYRVAHRIDIPSKHVSILDLNNSNQVIGHDWWGKPFFWENGRMTVLDVGDPSANPSVVRMNDAGVVLAGRFPCAPDDDRGRVFLWYPREGKTREVGCGYGFDLNNRNQVLLSLGRAGGAVWDDGTITPLNAGAGRIGVGLRINDVGEAVSETDSGDGSLWLLRTDAPAERLSPPVPPFCGRLVGGFGDYGRVDVQEINNDGDILCRTGIYRDGRFIPPHDIGRSGWLPSDREGGGWSPFYDLNERGQAVGSYVHYIVSQPGGVEFRAFLYDNGVSYSMESIEDGVEITGATHVNDRGFIVGTVRFADSRDEVTVLLAPVP
jgi:hypothetical protein